jgi:cation-transporting ATPase 13A2
MCGDGSNDCAALSAAHIGVALSKSEASVAVSPFSAANDSDSTSVGVVKQILCEGRAALTNSFAAFKFIVMYSVIQTIQVRVHKINQEIFQSLGTQMFFTILGAYCIFIQK